MAALGQLTVTGDWRNATEPVPSGTTNVFNVEVVTGLVDLVPRVPLGTQIYLPDYQVQGNNEVQRLGFDGDPASGTYTARFKGSAASAAIPHNATPTQLRTALEALSTVGAGNLSITGGYTVDYLIEFVGALANTDQPLFEIVTDSVVGGDPAFTIETPGKPILFRDTAVVLDPVFEARIWEGRLSTINVEDTLDFTVPAATPEVLASLQAQGIDELIYDVRFRRTVYAQATRDLRPFGVVATGANTSVCLTDPALPRVPYEPLEAVLRSGLLP